VEYLISKGVDASRMEAIGMGETEPIVLLEDKNGLNAGDVLSEEFILGLRSKRLQERAHQMNRRTDFKQIESDPEDAKKYGAY
jgi:outer membrane protein OmpA-like peptidoglycan-associated protein